MNELSNLGGKALNPLGQHSSGLRGPRPDMAVGVLFLVLLRIVNSPFGRVLQAIRENDFRAEALGFRTVTYRTVSTVLAALFATVAGALLALWLRYTGPDTTLSFEIMLDILLIVVIGGMGTLYGAVIGSVLFVLSVCSFPTGVVGRLRARVKIR